MRTHLILEVEHGEDTDRLMGMIATISEEYNERMETVYPGRPIVMDWSVQVDVHPDSLPEGN